MNRLSDEAIRNATPALLAFVLKYKDVDAGAPASTSRDDACGGTVTANPKDAA